MPRKDNIDTVVRQGRAPHDRDSCVARTVPGHSNAINNRSTVAADSRRVREGSEGASMAVTVFAQDPLHLFFARIPRSDDIEIEITPRVGRV